MEQKWTSDDASINNSTPAEEKLKIEKYSILSDDVEYFQADD